jgi:uncharacterized repeat protein (TIGR03806 family)
MAVNHGHRAAAMSLISDNVTCPHPCATIPGMRSCAKIGLASILLASLVACGGGGAASSPTNPPPPNPPPQSPPPNSGLDARPSNTTCVAPARPSGGVTLATERFTNLSFSSPLSLQQAPNDSSRWFVIQQDGIIRTFPNTASPSATDWANLSARVASPADGRGGETGLLGLAFHPSFPTDARVFVSYTAVGSGGLESRISAFNTTGSGANFDAGSEDILLTVDQPQDNHNGGHIAFGPDGFLYIGLGDGGGGNDEGTGHGTIGNGQNRMTLLGKMLRIDVDGVTAGQKYDIPAGNMNAGNPRCGPNDGSNPNANACPEIWAMGFRNPWRWNFDDRPGGSGELWLADVGQGTLEEADLVVAGGNYGWRCREGDGNFRPVACGNETNLINPVAQYGRTAGQSTTGGYVYRGSAIPALQGRYVFGDFATGNVWHIARDTTPTQTLTAASAFASGRNISSFGQGNDGELYIVDYGTGNLYRLQQGGGGGGTIPTQLSATGCVNASDAKQPAGGLIPFAPNAPFWSDGAEKDRWIAIPDGTTITVQGSGDWDFPNGTVLMKNFRTGTRLIETRLFMRHPDGEWAGYSYEWNDAQTDATRVVGGKEAPKGLTNDWIFPSESECLICHTAAAGRSLGIETAQLNSNFTYPATGRSANQLLTHSGIGTITPAISQDPATLPALLDPFGSGQLTDRARAYLHTNCSQCHRPNGGTPVNLDFRFTTPLSQTNACDATPIDALGIPNARVIAPGEAGRSTVPARMNRRDGEAMPPLGSNTVDDAGVTLITNWINGLTSCN